MARILRFLEGDRDVQGPKSEVDGYVQQVVGEDGTLYLYLYNYAQGGPHPDSSPTQSLHFDAESAAKFIELLQQTFGTQD